jgi:phage-related protein
LIKQRGKLAHIHWEGDSRDVLAGFPEEIRADLGFALFEMQLGKKPMTLARRMESIGPGVYELKESDKKTWYRVIYLSRIGDVIYVLHCFEKDSRKTDRRDLRVAKERLSKVHERIKEENKHAKHLDRK